MRKRFCLLPALALALLCACSKGAAKTPPTRPADFTSTERQFNTPADGDTIAIFDTSLGEVRAVPLPDRRADGCLQLCGPGPQRLLR